MLISRVFLGVVFLLAGLNGYFVIFGLEPFIATSPEAMALFEFEYLLIVEKSLEVICGILLNQSFHSISPCYIVSDYSQYFLTPFVPRSFFTSFSRNTSYYLWIFGMAL